MFRQEKILKTHLSKNVPVMNDVQRASSEPDGAGKPESETWPWQLGQDKHGW